MSGDALIGTFLMLGRAKALSDVKSGSAQASQKPPISCISNEAAEWHAVTITWAAAKIIDAAAVAATLAVGAAIFPGAGFAVAVASFTAGSTVIRVSFAVVSASASLAMAHIQNDVQKMIEGFIKSSNHPSCDNTPGPPPVLIDPLVINLDGNGIKLTDVATNTAYFDFGGDGFRERTGWVAPGTGFVVLDKNGNGSIDNGSELFGGPGEDGLAALAKFDANGDGRIDQKDAIFLQLRIWVDADGDAVTDAGELKTLAELGIKSILPQDTRLWA